MTEEKREGETGGTLEERVTEVLDKVRPALQADGGDVEFLGMDGNLVKLRLTGACHGCPMSMMTLKMGIEAALKELIPEIEGVITA
ncbi:MAG: NifU family protein [Myxococcota bacterium]